MARTKLENLLSRYLDEALSADEKGELEQRLLESAEGRNLFWKQVPLHSLLRDCYQARSGQQQIGAVADQGVDLGPASGVQAAMPSDGLPYRFLGSLGDATHGTLDFFSRTAPFSYLVAALLLGFGLWVGALIPAPNFERIAKNSSLVTTLREPVGLVTGLRDCRWADPNALAGNHAAVYVGSRYALASGLMEITYATGAKILLQGPAMFEVDTANGGYLAIGKLIGKLETGNTSDTRHPPFTIQTPSATITDLGTEFGVNVTKDQQSHVHVFQGAVMLHTFGATEAMASREIELKAGEGATAAWGGAVVLCRGTEARAAAGAIGFVRKLAGGLPEPPELPAGVTNPIDATQGLLYHLDAAVGVTVKEGLVTQWTDQSPNGNHFLGTDSGIEPLLIPSVADFRGLPAVRFDGSALNPLVLNKRTCPRMVIIVNRTNGVVPDGAGIWGCLGKDLGLRRENPGAADWQNVNQCDFPFSGGFYVNGMAGAHQLVETPGIVEAWADVEAWAGTSLGGYYPERAWAGDIAEIAAFDRALTEGERRLIVGYLGAKYGLRTPFPPPLPLPTASPSRESDAKGVKEETAP